MNKPQLFLLHFAGGNRYSFQFLLPQLSAFNVVALELPGRGNRLNEPLLDNFNEAASDLYQQVTDRLVAPQFLIYGHSMGAYLALRIGNMLEKSGKYPAGIVVSGNAGPGIREPGKRNRHLLNREEFIQELNELGGLPPELVAHEELFNFFEPVLRADFKIVELNDIASEPPVRTPIYAIMGSEEKNIADINNWAKFTTGHFRSEIWDGNHFFIYRHPGRLATVFQTCAAQFAPGLSSTL